MLTLQLKYLKKQLHIKKRPYKPLFIRLKKSAHKIKPFEYLLKAKTLGFEAFNFRCSSCEICFANFYVAVVQCRPVRRNSTFRRHGLTSVCFFIFANSIGVWLKFQKLARRLCRVKSWLNVKFSREGRTLGFETF